MRHREPKVPARYKPRVYYMEPDEFNGEWCKVGDVSSLHWALVKAMDKLKEATQMLRPCGFIATYPDGSYLLDTQWSHERAQWHKSKGARITRIRGVMEEW